MDVDSQGFTFCWELDAGEAIDAYLKAMQRPLVELLRRLKVDPSILSTMDECELARMVPRFQRGASYNAGMDASQTSKLEYQQDIRVRVSDLATKIVDVCLASGKNLGEVKAAIAAADSVLPLMGLPIGHVGAYS